MSLLFSRLTYVLSLPGLFSLILRSHFPYRRSSALSVDGFRGLETVGRFAFLNPAMQGRESHP